MKSERFSEDSKWQPQFIIIQKTPRLSETYLEPSKTSKMELFANIVDCIQHLIIFAKSSILGVLQGRCSSGKSKEKNWCEVIYLRKNRTAISVDFYQFQIQFYHHSITLG